MLASVALISTGPWPRSGPITPSAKITSRRTEGKREAKLSDVQANQNLQAAPEGAPLGCKPLHGPAQGRSASGDRGADFRGPGDAMSDRKENAKTPAGAPVMKAASSLVRNDTVPTRSASTSGRLIACMEAAWRYSSSMLAMPARGARDRYPDQARKRNENNDACQRGQAEKDCLAHIRQRNACKDEPPDLPKRECCNGHDQRGPPPIRPTRAFLRSCMRELVACAERRHLKRAPPHRRQWTS